MKRLLLILILFMSFEAIASAQCGQRVFNSLTGQRDCIGSGSSSGGFTFTGLLSNLPATCTVGQVAFVTNATPGQNIYECAATNTWTQQLNSGAGGASTALDNLSAVSVNTALLAQTGVALGSTTKPFSDLFMNLSGTFGTNYVHFTGTPTAARAITVPDANSTTVVADTGASNNFLTAISAAGAISKAQPTILNLAAFSSANLATQLTDESGTGVVCYTISCSMTTPLLGTPTSGIMTNVTGLPLTSGVTGTLGVTNGGTGLATTTANQILYSSASNTVAGLATANSAVLVTSVGGVPSLSTTIPSVTLLFPIIGDFSNATHDHSSGGGGGNLTTTAFAAGNKEGNGSKIMLFAGADPATDDCAKFDANHNIVTAGAACGSGGTGITALTGDVTATGSGSVTSTVVNLPTGVTQGGYLAATAIAAPGTPAAGLARLYVDSTSLNFAAKNANGVVNHGIRTDAGTANSWVATILDDGTVTKTQPAFTNISGVLGTTQMVALTGDVTNTSGTVATTIANQAVTLAKMANVATGSLLGRNTAGTGVPEVLTTIPAGVQTNITQLGTITTGTWNGTAVANSKGGTGGDSSAQTGIAHVAAGTWSYSSIVNADVTSIDAATKLTGIAPGANGGTGNGFFAVTGPTTSLKTFTLPNASSTILTSNAAVTVSQGGTGGTTFTANGVLVANGTSAFNVTAAGTNGQVLTANTGSAPTWQSAGAGTVTVVSAGALTSTALVTGGGTTTLQTACATCTLTSAGVLTVNSLSLGGSTSACTGGTAGCTQFDQGTAPSGLPTNGIQQIAPTSVTSFQDVWPTSAGATGVDRITVSGTTATHTFGLIQNGDISNTSIDLTAKVTGILPGANGGSNNAFWAVTGPTTSLKTFTYPNASATVLTTNAAVTVSQGGSGAATFTANGVLYGNGTSAFGAVAAGTTGQVLTAVTGSAPVWGSAGTGTVTSAVIAGTANQITASGTCTITTTGTCTLSIPTSPTLPGTTTGTFSGNLTGNVTGNASGTAATITGLIVEANTPMTTKGDLLVEDGTTLHRLGVGTNGQVLNADSTATDGVAWITLPFSALSGTVTAGQLASAVDARTTTTEAIQDADRGKLITATNGSASAYSIAQAGQGGNFLAGWFTDLENTGAGAVTITPSTSTVDGAATLIVLAGQGTRLFSDGSNYFTQRGGIGMAFGDATGKALTGDSATAFFSTGTLEKAVQNAATVYNDTTNTGTTAMTLDMSASTSAAAHRVPNIAGAAPTTAGTVAYDTINKNVHWGANGVDTIAGLFLASALPADQDCVKATVTSGVIRLASAGAACGSGGGGTGGGTSGWSGLPLTFATTTTQYAPYAGGGLPSATETAVSTKASGAATISNLHVTLDAAIGASATMAITLEDGTATASTLTCTTASGGTSCDDTTHSVNVANADLLSWKLVSSGTVTAGLPQIKISYAVGTSNVGTTSVSFTGGLISVATATTTPALTVAMTSGGIVYGASASTWASSGVLGAGQFVLGGGAGTTPTAANISGDCTTSGSAVLTCVQINGSNLTVNSSGIPTKVAGITTTGMGVPVVGWKSVVTGQTTSQGTVTLASAPAAGDFDLHYAVNMSTACTTGANSVNFAMNWTDASTRTMTTGSMTMGAAQTSTSFMSGVLPLHVTSGDVTYTSTINGTCASGTSAYDVRMWLERVN